MIQLAPKSIKGKWAVGYTLDDHTVASDFLGHDEYGNAEFETRRSEMGELLFRLKYDSDRSVLSTIAQTVAEFLESTHWPMDLLVPTPPSSFDRKFQPVPALTEEVAKILDIEYCPDCITKIKETPQLKNIYKLKKRMELLHDAFDVRKDLAAGKSIVVLDDLFRSGATLNMVTRELIDQGEAKDVYVLTLTRTRSNK